MVSSSIVVAVFFAISLALSGLWPVPGHMQATFWTGFMNRLAWAFSPLFLGGFFPGLCNPQMMRDWQIHRYFLVLGLLPFIIANVAFPYVVGTDSHFKASCPLYIYIIYTWIFQVCVFLLFYLKGRNFCLICSGSHFVFRIACREIMQSKLP